MFMMRPDDRKQGWVATCEACGFETASPPERAVCEMPTMFAGAGPIPCDEPATWTYAGVTNECDEHHEDGRGRGYGWVQSTYVPTLEFLKWWSAFRVHLDGHEEVSHG